MKRFFYRLYQIQVIIRLYVNKVLYACFHKDCMNAFLLSERGNDARDNAYAFYRYLKINHPDITVKYVITKKSPDYSKINAKDVILYNSSKHYKFLLYSKYLVSTHIMGYTPNTSICMRLNHRHLLPIRGKTIFLQHGITKDYSKLFDYEYTHLDLFVCAANREKDFIQKYNHYPEKNIKSIGFCRFDTLDDKSICNDKSILIMPTWRYWHFNMSDDAFKKDLFYIRYQELLNDKNFLDFIDNNGIEVYFYLHHETQKYLKLFSSKSAHLHLCSKEEFDVQDLLKKSKVLITDYSSVYFDFAFMQKKVIYYHFDYNRYRETHPEGFFNYENDGFGKVTIVIDEIVNELQKSMDMDETYKNRVCSFYSKIDKKNCDRTFNEIISLGE